MRIKTFEKATIVEAMDAVKAEMGNDAVILEVKEEKLAKGLFGPFSRPVVTVVAATDLTRTEAAVILTKEASKTSVPPNPPLPAATKKSAPTPAQGKCVKPPVPPVPEARDGKSLFRDYVKALYTVPPSMPPTSSCPPASPCPLPVEKGEQGEAPSREGVLAPASLRRFEQRVVQRQLEVKTPVEPVVGLEEPQVAGRGLLKGLYKKVLETGLDAETASHLFGLVVKKMEGDHFTEDVVRAYLRDLIREWVARCAAPAFITHPGKIIALVGPTGVGKTTTLIKIASRLNQAKKKVTLATMDTYRVGAVEQLRTYAHIAGFPIRVISSSTALQALWKERREGEYLLMDTAGRSPFHSVQLQQLEMLAQVPMEVHLTLSATTREADLTDTLSSFSQVIPIDRLLFTKLDETRRLGSLLSVIRKGGKIGRGEMKPSYFTTGQQVPEDIEEATPERIAMDVVPSL